MSASLAMRFRRRRRAAALAAVFAAACSALSACHVFLGGPGGPAGHGAGAYGAAASIAGLHIGALASSSVAHASDIGAVAGATGAVLESNGLEIAGVILKEPSGTATDYVIAFCFVVFCVMNFELPVDFVPFASPATKFLKSIKGDESIMVEKAHGTCSRAPMQPLRWGVDLDLADKICCFNREKAENSGYWLDFLTALQSDIAATADDPSLRLHMKEKLTFYDSVTGKSLFIAPRGRSFDEFVQESKVHGWPSFRDEEVVEQNVRVLYGGETVSLDGTHLGHNLPDVQGNRYCINIVSIAGKPAMP